MPPSIARKGAILVGLRARARLVGLALLGVGWIGPPHARLEASGAMNVITVEHRISLVPCRSGTLSASATWTAATESISGGVTFRNKGSAGCILKGYPRLQLVDARGKIARTTLYFSRANVQVGIRVPLADRRTGFLRSHHQVFFWYIWRNWCDGKLLWPVTLRVQLPGGAARVDVLARGDQGLEPWVITPVCVVSFRHQIPSYVSVGPFQLLAPGEIGVA